MTNIATRVHYGFDILTNLKNGWFFNIVPVKKKLAHANSWHTIAQFATKIIMRPELAEKNINRIHNMKLAAVRINGLCLNPAQIFSLSKIVGCAKKSRGYKKGPVLLNGRLTFAEGGGLCQVSTTLFNAALLANCEILEKFNHSSDIWGDNRFIELGKDAVYVFGRKDLKFRNNSRSQLVVQMDVNEDDMHLTCKILSPDRLPGKVKITTDILKTILPEGVNINKNIRKGWLVETKRQFINNTNQEKQTYHQIEEYQPVILNGQT